ncbi:NADH-quinone oxidoreductase subunit C [candidate division KSB1 bacterium]
MNDEEKKYIDKVQREFADSFISVEEFRGDIAVNVKKDSVFEIIQFLKESPDAAFDFLVDITAVDYLKLSGPERYAVIYHLQSYTYLRRLRIKAWVPEDDLSVPSMYPLWKTADWQEREVHEMFGISFTGHPDLRPLLLPDDFRGFPLRKDFPLKGTGYRENFPNLKNV